MTNLCALMRLSQRCGRQVTTPQKQVLYVDSVDHFTTKPPSVPMSLSSNMDIYSLFLFFILHFNVGVTRWPKYSFYNLILICILHLFISGLASRSSGSRPSSSSHRDSRVVPCRLASLTHVCQQRTGNTDHSILSCPNISKCFHIRSKSLETTRHLLFISAINYSPWYELQSRKAKPETWGEAWGWREAHCKERREKRPGLHRGSEGEINGVKRHDVERWEETTAESV